MPEVTPLEVTKSVRDPRFASPRPELSLRKGTERTWYQGTKEMSMIWETEVNMKELQVETIAVVERFKIQLKCCLFITGLKRKNEYCAKCEQ